MVYIKLTHKKISISLKKNEGIIIDSLFILALALMPFWRTGLNGLWEIHDQGFPFDPIRSFFENIYVWDPFTNGGFGFPAVVTVQHIWPTLVLRASFAVLGLPASIMQRIELVLATFLSGMGIYFLLKNLFSFSRIIYSRFAGLFGALFYMMNPSIMYWMFLGSYPLWAMSILPWFIIFLHRGFIALQRKKSYVIDVFMVALLSTVAFTTHPELSVLIVLFLIMFLIYETICSKLSGISAKNIVEFVAIVVLAMIGVNLWWILPFFYFLFESPVIASMTNPSYVIDRVKYFSNYPALMIQAMRHQVFQFNPEFYPRWHPFFQWVFGSLGLIVGIMPFMISVLAVLMKYRMRHLIFFISVALVFLSFSTGLYTIPTVGGIYLWLLNNTQFFRILSDPLKFLHIVTLSTSVLLGVSTVFIFRIGRYRLRQVAAILIGGILLTNAFPLLSGNFYGVFEPVDIPAYFKETSEWLSTQPGHFRIVILPYNIPGYSALYDWVPRSVFGGYQPYYIAFDAPWSLGIFPVPHVVDYSLYGYLVNSEITTVGPLLNMFNIKYILVEKDLLDPITRNHINTSNIENSLLRKNDLHLVDSIGKIDIFENLDYKDSLIYGTTAYLVSPNNLNLDLSVLGVAPPDVAFINNASAVPTTLRANLKTLQNITLWENVSSCENEKWTASNALLQIECLNDDANLEIKRLNATELTEVWLGFLTKEDWSHRQFIKFTIKSNEVIKDGLLMILDQNDRRLVWHFSYLSPNQWTDIILPMTAGKADYGPFDPQTVHKLNIQFIDTNSEFIWLRGVEVGTVENSWINEKVHNLSINYTKMNPTKYILSINTDSPFLLVFSETYDNGWRAIVPVGGPEFRSFPVNGFFNGWYITKTGKYNIVLEYTPQHYLELGAILTTVVISIFILLILIKLLHDKQ